MLYYARRIILLIGVPLATATFIIQSPTPVAAATSEQNKKNNNLYEGTWGTCKWYISQDYTLHIGAGTLAPSPVEGNNSWSPWDTLPVETISFDGIVKLPSYSDYLFATLVHLKNFKNTQNLDFSDVNSAFCLFANNPQLTEISLPNMNVENLDDAEAMFENNSHLEKIDISNWNISHNQSNLSFMFHNNPKLKSINLTNVQTPHSGNMEFMFADLPSLKELDLSSFITDNCLYMGHMFENDVKLSKLNIVADRIINGLNRGWYFSNVQDASYMFHNTKSLKKLDTKDWSSNFMTDMRGMFKNSGVENLDFSNWYMLDIIPKEVDYNHPTLTPFGESAASNGLFDGTHLKSITLGPNSQFSNKIDLPATASTKWVSTGQEKFTFDVKGGTGHSLGDLYPGKKAPGYVSMGDPTLNPQGKITFVPANNLVTADVTIQSNLKEQVVKNITGEIGKSVDVPVPIVKGYTADKSTIKATVNDDRTITSTEKVHYTKIVSPHHNSGGSNPIVNHPETTNQKNILATFHDSSAQLYRIEAGKAILIKNRELAADSSWLSNQKITLNKNIYYQVATNEWVKDTQVYPYQAIDLNLKTKNQIVRLTSDRNHLIKNRALAPETNWFSDRLVIKDNLKYYRVATNEFVQATDIIL